MGNISTNNENVSQEWELNEGTIIQHVPSRYQLQSIRGRGSFCIVYDVIDLNTMTRLVVKIFELDVYRPSAEYDLTNVKNLDVSLCIESIPTGNFTKECELTQLMGEHQIGPKVHKYMIRDATSPYIRLPTTSRRFKVGILFMEALDMTVADWKEKYNPTADQLLVYNNLLSDKYVKLAKFGIYHSDLHEHNIMINIMQSGTPIHVFIIDWGDADIINSTVDHQKNLVSCFDQC